MFLDDERVTLASEPGGIMATWRLYARQRTPSPKLWVDAWLAAFATCGGFQFVTLDNGFSQFPAMN